MHFSVLHTSMFSKISFMIINIFNKVATTTTATAAINTTTQGHWGVLGEVSFKTPRSLLSAIAEK